MKTLLPIFLLVLSVNVTKAQSGSLDPAFGKNGFVTTDMGSPFAYSYSGKQVLLSPDGSIYLVSEGNNNLTIIEKKHSDGSVDSTYGNNGISAAVNIGRSHGALQADGKVVVGGYYIINDRINYSDFGVARFKQDGTLDSSFNGVGIQLTDLMDEDIISSIVIQPDGKILAVGFTNNYYTFESNLAMARYNTDGSLDGTFNGTGIKTSTVAGFNYGTGVALQTDGKIVVSGRDNFSVARFNANGSPDITFDGDGFQSTTINTNDFTSGVAIQNDGKIVVSGFTGNGDSINNKFMIARYNTDGSLDNGFNGTGFLFPDFGVPGQATAVAIQSDQKIVVAGHIGGGNIYNFLLLRYNPDGTPDNSFSGDGKQETDFGGDDFINSMVIQADGKIIAMGSTFLSGGIGNIAVARYDTNGTLDNTFAGDGTLQDGLSQGSTFFTSTAVQSDGKLLSAGYTWNGTNYDFALVRYKIDGNLDSTFSADGKQTVDFGATDDKVNSIVIQNDGKIIIGGSASGNFAVARFNPDGSPDLSFDGDGKLTTDLGANDVVNTLVIQTDGKIIAAGTAMVRYNTNGTLDASFNGDGMLITPFTSSDIALQADGKIVTVCSFNFAYRVLRYNPDGTQDLNFGPDIRSGDFQIGPIDLVTPVGKLVRIQTDGKILIGGSNVSNVSNGRGSSFLLLRLTADGNIDSSFNGAAYVITPINALATATTMLLQDDGKIVMAGYSNNGSNDDFTVARFNTNGSLDNSFSEDGKVVSPLSITNDRIFGVALKGGYLYATGTGQYPGDLGVVARYLIDDGGPLPVTLLTFNAVLQTEGVNLTWQTASEQNLAGFVVQRSLANSFTSVGFVTAKGNTGLKSTYSLVDKQPLKGINFYRLKMTDKDGKFTYSRIVSVNLQNELFSFNLYPNPVQHSLLVSANGYHENATFELIDDGGKKLKTVSVILNAGTSFSIDVNSLPKGMYHLQLHTTTKTETKNFIKE